MASKILALTFTLARVVIMCHFLFNCINCFSFSNGNRWPKVAEVVEEGAPEGPSRSELVRAWLRAVFPSSRGVSDRKRAVSQLQTPIAGDDDLPFPAYEDSLAATYKNTRPFRNVASQYFSADSSKADERDYDNLDPGSDWLAALRRSQTPRQMVSSSADDSRFPIVFAKRNLCCSLDLYCTNCDDQKRKRNSRLSRVH